MLEDPEDEKGVRFLAAGSGLVSRILHKNAKSGSRDAIALE